MCSLERLDVARLRKSTRMLKPLWPASNSHVEFNLLRLVILGCLEVIEGWAFENDEGGVNLMRIELEGNMVMKYRALEG